MKLKAIIFAATMLLPGHYAVTGAFAEDAAPDQAAQEKTTPAAPAPQQQAPPQKFYFEVEQADIAAISQALNELPKRVADPLILKLNAQLQPQAQAQIVVAKDAAEKMKKGSRK